MQKSFAERVRDEAIKYSCKYQSVFVDYEFILFSKAFQSQQYVLYIKLSASKLFTPYWREFLNTTK